mmetsp:Transcript_21561/g.59882  ORF Transcript_21561/g.59882 Transcript_21561/m.59882 type:complete len:301 (+) Transcript_21561:907-1809(+)
MPPRSLWRWTGPLAKPILVYRKACRIVIVVVVVVVVAVALPPSTPCAPIPATTPRGTALVGIATSTTPPWRRGCSRSVCPPKRPGLPSWTSTTTAGTARHGVHLLRRSGRVGGLDPLPPRPGVPLPLGIGDETGGANAVGATLHLPLAPGATWEDHYQPTLAGAAREAIVAFGPDAVVISLGLVDTHASDPCATRRAGFELRGSSNINGNISGNGSGSIDDPSDSDYYRMGIVLGSIVTRCGKPKRGHGNGNGNGNEANTPTVPGPAMVLQEGGYAMEAVPSADVVLGMAAAMDGSSDFD